MTKRVLCCNANSWRISLLTDCIGTIIFIVASHTHTHPSVTRNCLQLATLNIQQPNTFSPFNLLILGTLFSPPPSPPSITNSHHITHTDTHWTGIVLSPLPANQYQAVSAITNTICTTTTTIAYPISSIRSIAIRFSCSFGIKEHSTATVGRLVGCLTKKKSKLGLPHHVAHMLHILVSLFIGKERQEIISTKFIVYLL